MSSCEHAVSSCDSALAMLAFFWGMPAPAAACNRMTTILNFNSLQKETWLLMEVSKSAEEG